jgi:hypothetical protein
LLFGYTAFWTYNGIELSLTPVAAEDRLEEARWIAQEVATLLDVPYREPVLVNSNMGVLWAGTLRKSGLLRDLVAQLDDDEFLFWVTYNGLAQHVVRDSVGLFRPNLLRQLKMAALLVLALAPALALFPVSEYAALGWICLILPVGVFYAYKDVQEMMFQISHQYFEAAAQLTGAPDAGERLIRKMMTMEDYLSRSAWVQRARQGHFYKMIVPPQYRKV